jgi:hypothetical protein
VRGLSANIAITGRGLTMITINDHTAKLSVSISTSYLSLYSDSPEVDVYLSSGSVIASNRERPTRICDVGNDVDPLNKVDSSH